MIGTVVVKGINSNDFDKWIDSLVKRAQDNSGFVLAGLENHPDFEIELYDFVNRFECSGAQAIYFLVRRKLDELD